MAVLRRAALLDFGQPVLGVPGADDAVGRGAGREQRQEHVVVVRVQRATMYAYRCVMTLRLNKPMPKVSVARASELGSYANVCVPAVCYLILAPEAIIADCNIRRRIAEVNACQLLSRRRRRADATGSDWGTGCPRLRFGLRSSCRGRIWLARVRRAGDARGGADDCARGGLLATPRGDTPRLCSAPLA